MRGTPPKWNYLLESGPLVVQAPLLGECSRSPSVSVDQLALLWEAVFGFSEFFLKTLSIHLPISSWVIYERPCPHRVEWSEIFDQKWHDSCAPRSLFTQSLPQQRETFCQCRRRETKNGRNTKDIKIDAFKNCFEQWKKISVGPLHRMGSTLMMTEVYTCKNKHKIVYQ